MLQRELMNMEGYFIYKKQLTVNEIFDIWWSGDWTHEDVFISDREDSVPESMYFFPEILGKIQPSAKKDIMFAIYKPADKKIGGRA